MESHRSLDTAWWALRIGVGTVAFLAGLDKFFNIFTDWSQYVSSFTEGICRSALAHFSASWGSSKCWWVSRC
jgi:hypothetical protein